MPRESLWGGYLKAEQRDIAEQERAEEKKRRKLEEQLQNSILQKTKRDIEQSVREYEYQERFRSELEKVLPTLNEEQLREFYTGIKAEKPEYPFTVESGMLLHRGTGETKQLPKITLPSEAERERQETQWQWRRDLFSTPPERMSEEDQMNIEAMGYRWNPETSSWEKPVRAGGGTTPFLSEVERPSGGETPVTPITPTGITPTEKRGYGNRQILIQDIVAEQKPLIDEARQQGRNVTKDDIKRIIRSKWQNYDLTDKELEWIVNQF